MYEQTTNNSSDMEKKELSYEEQCEKCKDTLRPMAAEIFGHMYQVEANNGNQWLHDHSTIKSIAERAVLAASCICSELNRIYGET